MPLGSTARNVKILIASQLAGLVAVLVKPEVLKIFSVRKLLAEDYNHKLVLTADSAG